MIRKGHCFNKMLLLLILLLPFFGACKKNKNVSVLDNDRMNTEEAFALVEGALAIDAEGLMREVLAAVDIIDIQLQAASPNPHCDLADSRYESDIFDNQRFQGTFMLNSQWILNCQSASGPEHLAYSWEGNITYESRKYSEEVYTDGTLNLAASNSAEDWLLSGTYERTGRQWSKMLTGNIYETSLLFQFNELSIDRQKRESRSGSATFDISGTMVGGRTFFLGGNITFTEKGRAEMTIGDDMLAVYPFSF